MEVEAVEVEKLYAFVLTYFGTHLDTDAFQGQVGPPR